MLRGSAMSSSSGDIKSSFLLSLSVCSLSMCKWCALFVSPALFSGLHGGEEVVWMWSRRRCSCLLWLYSLYYSTHFFCVRHVHHGSKWAQVILKGDVKTLQTFWSERCHTTATTACGLLLIYWALLSLLCLCRFVTHKPGFCICKEKWSDLVGFRFSLNYT